MPSSRNAVRYAWFIAALLFPVALLNYLDRQLLATMKASMGHDIPSIAGRGGADTLPGGRGWPNSRLKTHNPKPKLRFVPADVLIALKEKLPQATDRPTLDHPAVNVPLADLPVVLAHLRDAAGFDLLMDVTAIGRSEGVSPRQFRAEHGPFSTPPKPSSHQKIPPPASRT